MDCKRLLSALAAATLVVLGLFCPATALADEGRPIEDGVYYIESCAHDGLVFETCDDSPNSSVRVGRSSGSEYQQWEVTWTTWSAGSGSYGAYTIRNVGTGTCLHDGLFGFDATPRHYQGGQIWVFPGEDGKWSISADGDVCLITFDLHI